MFDPNDSQHHNEVDFLESEAQESGTSRFYKAAGNISEFGLYFSGAGLTQLAQRDRILIVHTYYKAGAYLEDIAEISNSNRRC